MWGKEQLSCSIRNRLSRYCVIGTGDNRQHLFSCKSPADGLCWLSHISTSFLHIVSSRTFILSSDQRQSRIALVCHFILFIYVSAQDYSQSYLEFIFRFISILQITTESTLINILSQFICFLYAFYNIFEISAIHFLTYIIEVYLINLRVFQIIIVKNFSIFFIFLITILR